MSVDDEEFQPITPRKGSNLVDDESFEIRVQLYAPLTGIRQTSDTNDEWLLGSSRVGKIQPEGGSSWRSPFDSTTRFYTRRVGLPDGRVVVAVILRITDHSTTDEPLEQCSGWVPIEREAEATGWIDFLNAAIRRNVAAHPRRAASR